MIEEHLAAQLLFEFPPFLLGKVGFFVGAVNYSLVDFDLYGVIIISFEDFMRIFKSWNLIISLLYTGVGLCISNATPPPSPEYK